RQARASASQPFPEFVGLAQDILSDGFRILGAHLRAWHAIHASRPADHDRIPCSMRFCGSESKVRYRTATACHHVLSVTIAATFPVDPLAPLNDCHPGSRAEGGELPNRRGFVGQTE